MNTFEFDANGPSKSLHGECPFCKQRVTVSVPHRAEAYAVAVRSCTHTTPDLHGHEIQVFTKLHGVAVDAGAPTKSKKRRRAS